MGVSLIAAQKIVSGTAPLKLAQFFAVGGTALPPYLVVTAFDRDAYAAGASDAVGAFSGNGAMLALAPCTSLAARGACIVFTWTGSQYWNATYGAFSQLRYVPSASAGDVTTLSVFTTSSAQVASLGVTNPLALAQADPAGSVGSACIVTDAHAYVPPSGANVTPDAIAAAAQSFVGRAWNDQGCWVLASTITAEAGAGLPITAAALGVAGHASGRWVVVYNGPVQPGAGWRSLVTAGDVITFGTPGGGGHITTCVAGSGASAMLIDNVVYENAQGQILNAADDGDANDVLVAPAHPAAQEFAGVAANSVVIYALDTPVVSAAAGVPLLAAGQSAPLSALARVVDPAGRAISRVQVYDPGQASILLVGGSAVSAPSAALAVGAASLAAITVEAAGADTLEVRAFNGLYWGDWQAITVGTSQAPVEPGFFAAPPQEGHAIPALAVSHSGH